MSNSLVRSRSPYLLQHAENPVDWCEWSEAAFARARTENKPIFLSIGYSTCHWCHVMAHESFEDAGIASLLNEYFVSIKVDREERPDVDRVYMTYVQALTGHGGWPLSVWLTPDLQPFFGGTYFPPADRGERPGFGTLLRAIGEGWRDSEQRAKMIAEGARVIEALQDHARGSGPNGEPPTAASLADDGRPEERLLEAAQEAFEKGYLHFYESFDAQNGGFGGAPKFPRASVINFLFRCAALQGTTSESGKEAIQMATHTLQQMARGGIHDHVGGGFHRYSVDERWFVPHFEKMLYDQAQIAINFLDAKVATGDERYAWLARDIFTYALRDMAHPEGAFYSAEDADSRISPHDDTQAEGAFYVWSLDELRTILGDNALEIARVHFDVRPEGNVPAALDPHEELRGKNILAQRQSLEASARALNISSQEANDRVFAALAALRGARAKRPRPHLDDKIITAWNGLMISALARGHGILERGAEDPLELRLAATRAATFLRTHLFDEATGTLYRTFRGTRSETPGFAEDYAFLIQGLLDLYEATFELRWLQWAEKLQDALDERFWDEAGGGYFSAGKDDPHLVLRLKEDYDGAEPSANSVAAANLLRFAALFHSEPHRTRAWRVLDAFRPRWSQHPQAMPEMLTALELALQPPQQVVLAGDPDSRGFCVLASMLHRQLGPRRVVLAADGGEGQAWLAAHTPVLAEMRPFDGEPTAYVCENYRCHAPVTSPEDLWSVLNQG